MHKLEWLMSAVMSLYQGASTVVKTVYGNGERFQVKVDLHQGSPLSPLLIVMLTAPVLLADYVTIGNGLKMASTAANNL